MILHGMSDTITLKEVLKMALLNDGNGKPVTFSMIFIRRSGKGTKGQRGVEKHCKKLMRNANPRFPDDGALHSEYTNIFDLVNLETGNPFRVDIGTIYSVNGKRVIKAV